MQSGACERLGAEDLHQSADVEGFGEDVGDVFSQGVDDGGGAAGGEADLDVEAVGFDAVEDLAAVAVGEHEVEEDPVGALGECVEGFLNGLGLKRDKVREAKDPDDRSPGVVVVFHHQHLPSGG